MAFSKNTFYSKIFLIVASERVLKNDIDIRDIHTHLITVFSTAILMWAYTLLAMLTIFSPVPGIIGAICSLVHLFSPLLFRYTNNSFFPSQLLLTMGYIHQVTFSYYTGGYDSIIWLSSLPMLGGLLAGARGAITWMLVTFLSALTYFILYLNDYQFPYLISENGQQWSKALLIFGWIFLNTIMVLVYSNLRGQTEVSLKRQKREIEDLFRVLFHDLANPMGRVAIGISVAKKRLSEESLKRGLDIIQAASDSMIEITKDIRNIYVATRGLHPISPTEVGESIEYVIKLYEKELANKNLTIKYDYQNIATIKLLVEPVSFNNQVLPNILSNAIKYSSPGSEISLALNSNGNGTCNFSISDKGIGIPVQLLHQLFDINKKISRPGTNGETGTGFGMHIVKSFVDSYGGELLITSSDQYPNSGTTVKMILRESKN